MKPVLPISLSALLSVGFVSPQTAMPLSGGAPSAQTTDVIRLLPPANARIIHGFSVTDESLSVTEDSLADLSNVTRFGKRVSWKYFTPSGDTVVEHRGKEWKGYVLCNGSSAIIHHENSRELRDFHIPLLCRVGSDTVMQYTSESIRDNAFIYKDTGTAHLRTVSCPRIILAEGDTVRDAVGYVTDMEYFRYLIPSVLTDSVSACVADSAPPSPDMEYAVISDSASIIPKERLIATIREKETVWRKPGDLVPVAVAFSRLDISAAGDSTATNRATVFPSILNEDVDVEARKLTRNAKQTESANNIYHSPADSMPGDNVSPSVCVDGERLSFSAPFRYDLTVCDIDGRVVRTGRNLEGAREMSVSGLPAGEYVVRIVSGAAVWTKTIILKP